MRASAVRSSRDDLAAIAGIPRAVLAFMGRAAERLTRAATDRATIDASRVASTLPTPRGGRMGEQNDWNVTEAVRANTGHVYTTVNFTANQIEALNGTERLTARRPGDKQPTNVADHYILEALNDPNEIYSGAEMKGLTSGWLQTAGFAVWVKVRDSSGRQLQFWPLLPDRLKLVAGKERPVDGVNYYPDGIGMRPIGFPREDVILFRTRSLAGGLYGWPPLRAALYEKSIHDKSLRMQLAMFENMARPDYVLAAKLPVGKEREPALRRLWASLMIHHQGIDKSGLPLVVPEGTEVTTLGFGAKDAQLIQQLEMTRQGLFELFGTSDILHGYTKSIPARATLETEFLRYGRSTLEPMACCIWGPLNRDVIGELNRIQPNGVRLKLERDSAVGADKAFDLEKALDGFKSGLLTMDQGLMLLDLPPVGGTLGETRVPLAALGGPNAGTQPPQVTRATAAEVAKELAPLVAPELRAWLAEQIERMRPVMDVQPVEVRELNAAPTIKAPAHLDTDEKRAAHWRQQIGPQDTATAQARALMRTFFKVQAARIIPEMEREVERLQGKFAGWSPAKVLLDFERRHRARGWAGSIEPRMDHARRIADPAAWLVKMGKDDPGFDVGRERDALGEALTPIVRGAINTAGKIEAHDLSAQTNFALTWDLQNPAVNRWMESHVAQVAADITDTTAELLSAVARDGIAEGISTQEIAANMRTVFEAWSTQSEDAEGVLPGYRAARIARTEIAGSFGFGQQTVLEEADAEGLLEGEMWLTARDNEVRLAHQIDGEVVPVGEEFSNGMKYAGDMSVGDPSLYINERCTNAAVVKGA